MKKIHHIAIFCGSNLGVDEQYRIVAENLIDTLFDRQMTLVYGGAKVGLMGAIADRMIKHGGNVIGVIPKFLVDVEVAHEHLNRLHIVDSMHARKNLISDISDGFILLPGGHGSLDEFFEMITWAQLGLHSKPCGILNINGYYDDLLNMLDKMLKNKFIKSVHRNMVIVSESPHDLINNFMSYQPPLDKKWINLVSEEVSEV